MELAITSQQYVGFKLKYYQTPEHVKHLRYGQAFINWLKSIYPDQIIVDPSIFYEPNPAKAEELIFSCYVKDEFVEKRVRLELR